MRRLLHPKKTESRAEPIATTRQLLPLMQFVPAVSPQFREPRHLEKVTNVFERIARGEQVKTTLAAPPRIFKSETISHGIAYLLKQNPRLRICYATYASDVSARRSKRIRSVCVAAHTELDPRSRSAHDWSTGVDEGGVWATSVGGQLVSLGFDLIIVDDPIANRVAAESKLVRDRIYDWFNDVVATREEPNCSTIVLHHRWNEDDLIGRLNASGTFEEITLSAVNEDGTALCPERLPLSELEKKRRQMGDYGFDSLYLQRPRPRGSMVFGGVTTYTTRPNGLTITIGVDLAYSLASQRDYSAFVVLGTVGDVSFVIEAFRAQLSAPKFRDRLVALKAKYVGAPMIAFIGGVESGALSFFEEGGVTIDARNASSFGDKFTRSQSCAAAWNASKIQVPEKAAWLEDFVSEVVSFSGAKGGRDDQVDCLVAAYEGVRVRTTETSVTHAPAPIFMSVDGASFDSLMSPSVVVSGGAHQPRSLVDIEQAELRKWAGGDASNANTAPSSAPLWSVIHTSDIPPRGGFEGF